MSQSNDHHYHFHTKMCKRHLVLCRTCPIWPPVVSPYLTYTRQCSWWNHCISQLEFGVSRPHRKTYNILKKINGEVTVSTIQEATSSGYNTFKTYIYKRTQEVSTFQTELFSHTIKTKCEPLSAFLWWTHTHWLDLYFPLLSWTDDWPSLSCSQVISSFPSPIGA
jgi:hypothetical protein